MPGVSLPTKAFCLSFGLPLDSKRVGDISSEAVHYQRGNYDPKSIRDNPIDDRIRHSIMTHGAIVAEVLLSPVKDGLAKRHRCCCKTPKRSRRGTNDVSEVDGVHVHKGFDHVERCLSQDESVTTFVSLDTVYEIDILINRIRLPEPMKITTLKRPRPHETISDIPKDDRRGNEEPQRDPNGDLDSASGGHFDFSSASVLTMWGRYRFPINI